MSCIVVLPPSTRLLIGHEMNCGLRSINTTSISGAHILMYFAALPPPKPPPTTTTRALDGAASPALPTRAADSHPLSAAAPAPADIQVMNSRRETGIALLPSWPL